MKNKVIDMICSTDILPVGGGIVGANISIEPMVTFPTWETIVFVIVVSTIGAFTGYLVKLILDYIFKKPEK